MAIFYKGKPVYIINRGANIGDEAALDNIWCQHSWNFSASYKYNIFNCSKEDIGKKIQSLKTPLTQNSTLFFSSSSNYPRFKLADSGYKRCIKVEKADFVVVGEIECREYGKNIILVEDEEKVYMINKDTLGWGWRSDKTKIAAFVADPISYMKQHHLFYGSELSHIYTGVVVYGQSCTSDLDNIMNGTYKKIITDEELDKAINGNFEILNKESIASICDMLDSPDKVTQGVGLKILMGYNVQATPLTVRTILGLRERLNSCTEWKGVGVQQVLSSIEWRGFGKFPSSLWNILPERSKLDSYTDYDKDLCKDIYMRAARHYMDEAMRYVTSTGIPDTFGWEISYDVKEK